MKIGIIGAGKVGFSLGKFFAEHGAQEIQITGYCSRNQDSAKAAAAFTHSRYYAQLHSLVEASDAICITTPDGAISSVYDEICRFEIKNKYICHCSGALTAGEAFPGIRKTGAFGISVHPLFPISDKENSWRELADAFFCLEGDQQAVTVFQPLLTGLGLRVQTIAAENKIRYHAACVMASNFFCGLVRQSQELLLSCGFSPEFAADALSPLIRSNVAHLVQDGPVAALTGPVERCDTATVKKHLAALQTDAQRQLYCLLSLKLTEIASEKHPEVDYTSLRTVLAAQETTPQTKPTGHAGDVHRKGTEK